MSRNKTFSFNNNEPEWNNTGVSLIKGLNWYHHFSDINDSKKYTLSYMKSIGISSDIIQKASELPDYTFTTIGFACRIKERGAPLTEKNLKWISDKIEEIKKLCSEKYVVVDDSNKISPHQRLIIKANEYVAELEDIIDELVINKNFKFDTYQWMKEHEIKGAHIKYFVDNFGKKLEEINEVVRGKDEQLNEGYSNFTKAELKKYAALLTSILEDSSKILHNAKVTKAPRKKKPKSTTKLVDKLSFKKEDIEYKVVSIEPSTIIGAKQLWVFNTKTRKLGVYHALDIDGLSVKGTTLMNFNPSSSKQKTLRKPLELLPQILNGTKPFLAKAMDGINSVSDDLTGRINSDIILLRVLK